jgi:hypothetical protein
LDGTLGRNTSFPAVLNMAPGFLACKAPSLMIEVLCATVLTACLHHQTATMITQDQTEPAPALIQKVVEGISLIGGLPPKSGESQTDPRAIAIMSFGRKAAPYLVAKLTDTSLSRVVYAFPYTIGDLALALLVEIYQPQGWPFPDDRIESPETYGDYRDYVAFVNSPGSRDRLQKAWQEYVKNH